MNTENTFRFILIVVCRKKLYDNFEEPQHF